MRWKGLRRPRNRVEPYLRGFIRKPGASAETLRHLTETIRNPLPAAYLEFLRHSNGGEGFIGATYIRFYEAERIPEVNQVYEIEEYLPGLLLIASNTIGDAICLCPPLANGKVIQVPFIPLRLDFSEPAGSSFSDFLARLAASPPDGRFLTSGDINPEVVGKEVFQRHPIALGGSPDDPDNQALVPAEQHPRLVQFWNKAYHWLAQREASTPASAWESSE